MLNRIFKLQLSGEPYGRGLQRRGATSIDRAVSHIFREAIGNVILAILIVALLGCVTSKADVPSQPDGSWEKVACPFDESKALLPVTCGRGAEVWQTIDITLVGRRVTVVVNGKPVIVDQIIPGITGSAIDSDEAAPGPIMLQGEEQRVEFRNITVSVPKNETIPTIKSKAAKRGAN